MAKVSEITVSDIANYLRLTEVSEADQNFIENCLDVVGHYRIKGDIFCILTVN